MNQLTYYAQLDDNNVVVSVHVVTAEFMAENPERYPGLWVETFYNSATQKYAGIGDLWNGTEFTTPQTDDDTLA